MPQTQSGQSLLERRFLAFALGIMLIYAAGLTKEIGEPWVGLHDWNGAFFSQLARNLLRYPFEIHHGMPLVAAGSQTPPPAERSLYSTHPPGLVWVVAGVFALLGESETIARLIPIASSLGTMAILLWIWRVAFGSRFSLIAGLIYSVMPMSVYFGRMVDHEPICLLLMVIACAAWIWCHVGGTKAPHTAVFLIGASLAVNVWIDWSAWIFAAVFCAYLLFCMRKSGQAARNSSIASSLHRSGVSLFGIGRRGVIAVLGITVLSIAVTLIYMVEAGLAGHWSDLAAIFFSRVQYPSGTTQTLKPMNPGNTWDNTLQNFTVPLFTMVMVGLAILAKARSSAFRRFDTETGPSQLACIEARRSLFMLALTGGLWLGIFFRQYEVHQYWAFYLGPAIATLAALAFVVVEEKTRLAMGPTPRVALIAVFVAALAFECWGTLDYFGYDRPGLSQRIPAWKAIARMTQPTDRIALFRSPLWTEERGQYAFRNIIPPQFAYYCDRAFDIRRDFAVVAENPEPNALFVLPVEDAVNFSGSLGPLRRKFSEELFAESLVVYDLRNDRTRLEAGSPSSSSQPNN